MFIQIQQRGFNLDLNNNKSYNISIFNSLGQKVYNNVTNSMSMVVDLSELESGIIQLNLKILMLFTERIIIE